MNTRGLNSVMHTLVGTVMASVLLAHSGRENSSGQLNWDTPKVNNDLLNGHHTEMRSMASGAFDSWGLHTGLMVDIKSIMMGKMTLDELQIG